MTIFEESVSIMREAEYLVIGARVRTKRPQLESTFDALLHVPWFVLVGVREQFASFFFGLVLIPVWWCLQFALLWALGEGANTHSTSDGWIIATLFAASSVLFRLPSHSARLGVRTPQVEQLAAYIRSFAKDEETIKLLQSGISVLDAAGVHRITRLNWVLGLCWAGLAWAASRWIFSTEVPGAANRQAFTQIFGGFLVFLFFGMGTRCYETACRIVKQTIDFAFLHAADTRQAGRQLENALVEES